MSDDTQKLTEDLMQRIHEGVSAGLTPRDAARAQGVPFDTHLDWLTDGLTDHEDGKDTLAARYAVGLQKRGAARAVGEMG